MLKELIQEKSLSSLLGPPQGEGLPTKEQVRAAVEVVRLVYENAGAVGFRTFCIGDACTANATAQSDLDVAVYSLGDYADREELRCQAKAKAEETTGRSVDVLTFRDFQYFLNTDLSPESISE